MPVLGAASSSAQTKRGVYLPTGWNTVWKAARDAHASARTEVAIFGDSTTFGSATGTPNFYSWVQKLRVLSVGAGYTDGGRGIAGLSDTAGMSGAEGIPIIQSTSGGTWGPSGDGYDVLNTETPRSNVNGATIVFQGYGTACRLHYTKLGTTGTFTYAVDGGSPTTVNALGAATTADSVIIALGGTDSTLHTVTVVNTGSSQETRVVAEFMKTNGIVYHKHAISGISSSTFFGRQLPSFGNWTTEVALGLTPGTSGSANAFGWGMPIGAKPRYRNVSLAICALGVNDLQGVTIVAEGSPTTAEQDAANRATADYKNNLANFVRLTRAAEADPLIVVPHFDLAARGHTWGGQFAQAAWDAGMAEGCGVVNFNEAFRPVSTMVARGLGGPDVHSDYRTYDAEAIFLWQNALAL
jgi:VCBS repeat-containing protein